MKINPGSLVTSRLRTFFKDTELSLGAGFFYEFNRLHYLITNWHNVAGRHPKTFNPLDDKRQLPDRALLTVSKAGALGQWGEVEVLLYSDAGSSEQPTRPAWHVHPKFHQQVDVVAIPIKLPDGAQIYPISSINTVPDLRLAVTSDVFVLGYPEGISGGGGFPIWKRASIASEPQINLNNLPMMFVDTATRDGMSGGPVIAMALGGYTTEQMSTVEGRDASRFVGVYSGRVGDDAMGAQLGIVWKASVIDEIIGGQVFGTSSFLWTT